MLICCIALLAWGNLCTVFKTKLKTKKMITADHASPEGKLKTWMMGVGALVLSGIILTVVLVICKKPLHALEQAMS